MMQKLRLVPLASESVEERVAAFRQYNDEVSSEVYASFKKDALGSNCLQLDHPFTCRHHSLTASAVNEFLMKTSVVYGKSLHCMLQISPTCTV